MWMSCHYPLKAMFVASSYLLVLLSQLKLLWTSVPSLAKWENDNFCSLLTIGNMEQINEVTCLLRFECVRRQIFCGSKVGVFTKMWPRNCSLAMTHIYIHMMNYSL